MFRRHSSVLNTLNTSTETDVTSTGYRSGTITPPPESSFPARSSGFITFSGVNLDKSPCVLPEFGEARTQYEQSSKEKESCAKETVTFGDGHGNTLLLLYRLAMVGIVDITPMQYAELKKIYNAHNDLLKKINNSKTKTEERQTLCNQAKNDVTRFKEIIEALPIHHHLFTRYIGDLFGDRGAGDHFSWIVFSHLCTQQSQYEIIDSNHDHLMMRQYETGFAAVLKNNGALGGQMREGADRSLVNLGIALQHGIVTHEEISSCIESAYIPYLKPGSYDCVNEHRIDLYFHAPVDFLGIESAAKNLSVAYADQTMHALTETIDVLKTKLQEKIKTKTLQTLGLPEEKLKEYYTLQQQEMHGEYIFVTDTVGYRNVFWPRPNMVMNDIALTQEFNFASGESHYKKIVGLDARSHLYLPDSQKESKPYTYTFYHGHVGECDPMSCCGKEDLRYLNLDTDFGKTADNNRGIMTFSYCGSNAAILKLIGKKHKMPNNTPILSPRQFTQIQPASGESEKKATRFSCFNICAFSLFNNSKKNKPTVPAHDLKCS